VAGACVAIGYRINDYVTSNNRVTNHAPVAECVLHFGGPRYSESLDGFRYDMTKKRLRWASLVAIAVTAVIALIRRVAGLSEHFRLAFGAGHAR
jgi:hypothetical protein